jgi:outer membrane lipoprotein-sorting protein
LPTVGRYHVPVELCYKGVMLHRLSLTAIILFITVTASSAKEPPTVAEVVAQVVKAYGGEKKLRSINGYHANGEQWAAMSNQTIEAERWFGRPDRLRLTLVYPDHTEIRVTSGSAGWSGSSDDSLEPANPMKLMAMRLQSVRLDVPLRLVEQADKIALQEPDQDGRIVLRLAIEDGLHIDYHVDPRSYRIMRAVTAMEAPQPMEFAADYDGFKKVDGILVAMKETTYAGETLTSKLELKSFDWNPKDLEARLSAGTIGGN